MSKTAAKKKSNVQAVVAPPPRPRPEIGVRDVVRWVSEARPDKDIGVGMSFYIVRDGEIRATDGKMTASYPWMNDDVFLVSGLEFEKVLGRMEDDDVVIEPTSVDSITVRSGRFHATIATLPPDVWGYHGIEDAVWKQIPEDFVSILRSLRAFISDNPAQLWMSCVAIDNGNIYATNGIALAGSACDVGEVRALLQSSAIDFLLRRTEGLERWHASANYVAFQWASGAWMRVQCVEGQFPERAATMVREAYDAEPSQAITDEFREAFADVSALAEDTIRIYADRLEAKFKKSVVTAAASCEVPPPQEVVSINDKGRSEKSMRGGDVSIWGAGVLAPVISQATHWQPSKWPQPAPFKGHNVAGFVVGRKE